METKKKIFIFCLVVFSILILGGEAKGQGSVHCMCKATYVPGVAYAQCTFECEACPEGYIPDPNCTLACPDFPATCSGETNCACVQTPETTAKAWCKERGLTGIAKCIFEIVFTIPLRVVLFMIPLVGLLVTIIGAIFCLLTQKLAVFLIDVGLDLADPVFFQAASLPIINFIKSVAGGFLKVSLYAIALATIFRVREYEAQRLLLPLIVAGILMNFSGAIAKFIIDTGNTITVAMLDYPISVRMSDGRDVRTNIRGAFERLVLPNDIWNHIMGSLGQNMFKVFTADGDFLEALFRRYFDKGPFIIDLGVIAVSTWLTAIFYFAMGVILLIFGFMFILRVVHLWILYILAPLGLATLAIGSGIVQRIFPGPLHWSRWFPEIVEWSIMGMVLAFWLAVTVLFRNNLWGQNWSRLFSQTEVKPLVTVLNTSPQEKEDLGIIKIRNLASNDGSSPMEWENLDEISSTTASSVIELFKYLIPVMVLQIGVKNAPSMVSKAVNTAFGAITGVLTSAAVVTGIGASAAVIGKIGSGLKAGAGAFKEAWAERGEGVGGAIKAIGRGAGGFVKESTVGFAQSIPAAMRGGAAHGLTKVVSPIPQQIRQAVGRPMWVTRELEGDEKVQQMISKEIEGGYKAAVAKGGTEAGAAYLARTIKIGSAAQKHVAMELALKEKAAASSEFFTPHVLQFLGSREGNRYVGELAAIRPDQIPFITNPTTQRHYTPQEVENFMNRLTSSDWAKIDPRSYESPWVVQMFLSDPQRVRSLEGQSRAVQQRFAERVMNLIGNGAFVQEMNDPNHPIRKSIARMSLHPVWAGVGFQRPQGFNP